MTCPERYKSMYWWIQKQPQCAKDDKHCSVWRLAWCKWYIPLAILIIAAILYFGRGLARAIEQTENQVIITKGSLKDYKAAKKRSASIDGCYGGDEMTQKYKAWEWDSRVCQD